MLFKNGERDPNASRHTLNISIFDFDNKLYPTEVHDV